MRPSMRACLPGFAFAFDLGQEWFDWTGLPFVYAVWAVREGAELGRVTWALAEAAINRESPRAKCHGFFAILFVLMRI